MKTKQELSGGFTLVELMVGMAIGLVMLLVVSTLYVNSRAGFRTAGENSAQEESGHYALNLLARNIRMAGFTTLRADAAYPTSSISNYLTGCDLGYVNPSTSDYGCASSTPLDQLPSAALEVRYETDTANNSAAQGQDCIGNNSISTVTAAGSATSVVANRFFVTRDSRSIDGKTYIVGQLSCSSLNPSTGIATSSQPILQGIEQISFQYLLSLSDNTENAMVPKTASELNAAGTWDKVNAIQICILTRSIGKGLNTNGVAYRDCQNNLIDAPAKETYRTYTTMVGVRTNYRSSPLVAP